MAHFQELHERADASVHREWNLPAIQKRFRSLVENGIPPKMLGAAIIKG